MGDLSAWLLILITNKVIIYHKRAAGKKWWYMNTFLFVWLITIYMKETMLWRRYDMLLIMIIKHWYLIQLYF